MAVTPRVVITGAGVVGAKPGRRCGGPVPQAGLGRVVGNRWPGRRPGRMRAPAPAARPRRRARRAARARRRARQVHPRRGRASQAGRGPRRHVPRLDPRHRAEEIRCQIRLAASSGWAKESARAAPNGPSWFAAFEDRCPACCGHRVRRWSQRRCRSSSARSIQSERLLEQHGSGYMNTS